MRAGILPGRPSGNRRLKDVFLVLKRSVLMAAAGLGWAVPRILLQHAEVADGGCRTKWAAVDGGALPRQDSGGEPGLGGEPGAVARPLSTPK